MLALIKQGVCIFCLCFVITAYATCFTQDDVKHIFANYRPVKRIISLSPDLTEILFAIGAGKELVGVVEGSDYPKAAQHLPRVGTYAGLDIERLVALQPDLIIMWDQTFTKQVMQLQKLAIPVYVAKPQNLEDVASTMQRLGCLTGKTVTAQQAAKQFSERLATLRKRYQNKKTITVFYQIGTYSLITINQQSWINQAITLCGGKNVFANAFLAAPEVSWEAIIAANPQVVINDSEQNWQKPWLTMPGLFAVKHGNLFTIQADLLERAGPRLLDGVETLCQLLDRARTHR